MVRTWLLRGCAVAVFGVLAGAWGAGVVGHSGDPLPTAQLTAPEQPEASPAPRVQPGSVLQRADPERHRKAPGSDGASPSSTPSATEPTTPPPGTPSPSDTPHAPGSSGPTDDPSEPSSPSHPPSQSPSDPGDTCSGLGGALDCALDPVTGQP